MTLKQLADRVVVKMLEAEETTKSGIILTAKAQEKPQVAEVIAVGPGGMVDGKEIIGVAPMCCDKTEIEAKPQNDVWFYECKTEPLTLIKNSFMVLYPNDLHCPGVAVDEPLSCLKVVVKVKV